MSSVCVSHDQVHSGCEVRMEPGVPEKLVLLTDANVAPGEPAVNAALNRQAVDQARIAQIGRPLRAAKVQLRLQMVGPVPAGADGAKKVALPRVIGEWAGLRAGVEAEPSDRGTDIGADQWPRLSGGGG